jgi:hypothetical protein
MNIFTEVVWKDTGNEIDEHDEFERTICRILENIFHTVDQQF